MPENQRNPRDSWLSLRHPRIPWPALRDPRPLAAVALLVVMVLLSRDFGATWDERALQKYGEEIWEYYRSNRPWSAIDLSFGYTRIYGAFVEVLNLTAQQVVRADIYVVRHAVNSVFGWAGVVFAYLIASRLFGPRAGWLAAALLVLMPRYFADSMNNAKDLPFAVLMFASLNYIVTLPAQYPYLPWRHALKLAVAIALAINVRSMGLVLLGYAGIGVLVALVAARERSPARLGATAARFAVVCLLTLVGGSVFWPWAQEQPLVRPVQAFFIASSFSWGNPSVFAGRDAPASQLPWHYLPTWLAITLPPVVLAGAAVSLARLWNVRVSRVQLLALWAFVLVPATVAIVRHLTLYDGIRHVFFIVPPIAVIAAAGWDYLLARAPGRTRLAGVLLLAAGLAEPLWFQVRNHPNQGVYFSPVMGGPRGAFGRFEMDYWGNCVLQAVDWTAAQAARARMPIGVSSNAWEVAVVDVMRYKSLYFRLPYEDGHHFTILLLKGKRQDVLDASRRRDILHRVTTADGTPLCVVVPGPEYPRLMAQLR
ncbi:MAG: glycosyltransferase family 39 protein [Vicinamibacterales bacterium]